MTEAVGSSEILKTDDRGRVRFSPERREQLLVEFERSRLSAPQYCKVTGLSYSTFATWLQKRRRKRTALPPTSTHGQPIEWLETVVEQAQACAAPTAADALRVRLASGAVMEVATVAQASVAAALLRAWEKTPC